MLILQQDKSLKQKQLHKNKSKISLKLDFKVCIKLIIHRNIYGWLNTINLYISHLHLETRFYKHCLLFKLLLQVSALCEKKTNQ